MIPLHREALAYVAELGGTDAEILPGGNHGHLRLCFYFAGRLRSLPMSASPSDRNAIWMVRSEIRHMLGLVGGPARKGMRRQRRSRRRIGSTPMPPMTVAAPIADWRDTLRRHALYREPA